MHVISTTDPVRVPATHQPRRKAGLDRGRRSWDRVGDRRAGPSRRHRVHWLS